MEEYLTIFGGSLIEIGMWMEKSGRMENVLKVSELNKSVKEWLTRRVYVENMKC